MIYSKLKKKWVYNYNLKTQIRDSIIYCIEILKEMHFKTSISEIRLIILDIYLTLYNLRYLDVVYKYIFKIIRKLYKLLKKFDNIKRNNETKWSSVHKTGNFPSLSIKKGERNCKLQSKL